MPRVFPAQFIITLAVGGIALLAVPRITLGQSPDSQDQSSPVRQRAVIEDASDLNQLPPGAPVAPAPTTPPAVPSSPDTVAQLNTQVNMQNGNGAAAASAASVFSLATVPNMIGDTSGVGCGALTINGAVVASIMHPTFSCSRLNIAEDNSPVIQDRVYADFRDFQGASGENIFSNTPNGGESTLNIDRLTLGYEHTFWDANSIEFRLPINRELNSDLFFSQMTGPSVGAPPITNLNTALHNTATELGNIDIILKHRLVDTEDFYLSTGLGLNLPTAPAVEINALINDARFQVFNTSGMPVGPTHNVFLSLASSVLNQTVNASPFLGGIYHPTADWFMQGFLQVDVPLNSSKANLAEVLYVDGMQQTPGTQTTSTKLEEQVLGRINLGIGHWLWYGDYSRTVNSLGLMFEAHYSTTLNNAVVHQLTVAPSLNGVPATVLSVGNLYNHLDGLDFVLAVPAVIGRTTFTSAFCLPALSAPDRGFSFEYILTVDRMF